MLHKYVRPILIGPVALLLSSGLLAQVWRGTAPFCEGRCLAGEREIARNSTGDGGRCITGSKALCQGRNTGAACQVLQSNVECKGVVMICDNGFYSQTTSVPQWHSCARYVCGACLGFWSDWKAPVFETGRGLSTLSVRSLGATGGNQSRLPSGPDTCKPGLVWREAIAKDHVCVDPAVRQQARNDNASSAGRVNRTNHLSGPDTCVPGFVWREVIPADHVCVAPQVRERTRRENASVEANRVRGAGW